ncbi:hypothetical protein AB0C76_18550 [Kitasatospora sp. NPDC048722]|uniref:hypothetical protein n=1 Tax=Kitasatospora sp. NPDC048722 TaxID=3155639 RepID=UPI00340530EF
MEHDERSVHASSFGAAAVAYAEHRPGYVQAAVRWARIAARPPATCSPCSSIGPAPSAPDNLASDDDPNPEPEEVAIGFYRDLDIDGTLTAVLDQAHAISFLTRLRDQH